MSYKSTLLGHVMNEPKEWCETIECFQESDMNNIMIMNSKTYEEVNSNGNEFSFLMKKTKKQFLNRLDIQDAFDILNCEVNLIWDSYVLDKYKKIADFSVRKDDWIITSKRDYQLIIRLIRKNHPKSEKIRRKINECAEFGIIDGVSKRSLQVSGIAFIALIERFYEGNDQVIDKLNYILSYEKTNISLEDFKSTFKLLVYGLIISISVFMIEITLSLVFREEGLRQFKKGYLRFKVGKWLRIG